MEEEPQPVTDQPGPDLPRATKISPVEAARLRVSVNPGIVDKEVRDRRLFSIGWQNVSVSVEELIDSIGAGVPYCAQLKGPRKTSNFLASDIVSVDIDEGSTIAEALRNPLVLSNAAFLYTTPSHAEVANRFRVVFVLPRTVTSADEMVALSRAMALRLNGDPSATDATRIYFGNRAAHFTPIGKTVDETLFEELLAQGKGLSKAEARGFSQRSRLRLVRGQAVRLADGRLVELDEIQGKASVYCPYHADENASAFVVVSKLGRAGIHCSTCRQTYWPDHENEDKFDHFERSVRAAHEAKSIPAEIGAAKISIVSNRPAPDSFEPGITFVKSPKGSGKTEAVAHAVRYEKKVLVISHRRLLVRQIAKRLGLTSYLEREIPALDPERGNTLFDILRDTELPKTDERQPWKGDRDPRLKRFVVSLDSLRMIPPNMDYDLIVIDESEQVLAHFLSDTLDDSSRDAIFVRFEHLIKKAKAVVALDADLGWSSYHTLSRMREVSDSGKGSSVPQRKIWINEGKPGAGKVIDIFDSESALVGDFFEAVEAGKRCMLTSTSKDRAERLDKAIRERLPKVRTLVVTSSTGSISAVRRFIDDPAVEMLKYDVVLASPSLGTGVDITFPNQEQIVDSVYGFCDAGIVSHFDFDQQLARVRHPKCVKVWVTPQSGQYETHLDVVRHDILMRSLFKNRIIGFDDDGRPKTQTDDRLIDMAALIVSRKHASQNALRKSFIELKEEQGFSFNYVSKDDRLTKIGSELRSLGKKLTDHEFMTRILAVDTLPPFRHKMVGMDIENEQVIAPEIRWSFERTILELFYREKASPNLIAGRVPAHGVGGRARSRRRSAARGRR